MNYFAQGIQQGGEAGARGYLEKKKRDQDSALNKARLEFEAAQLKENFKGQGTLQEKRLQADAARQIAGFGQEDKARTSNQLYGTSEREAGQNWKTGESSKDRALTTDQGDKNRSAAEREASARLLLDAKRIQQSGEQFDATRSWNESPNNPQNQSQSAYAKRLLMDVNDSQPVNGSPKFSMKDEGRMIIGPDGKRYQVKNGVAVPQ